MTLTLTDVGKVVGGDTHMAGVNLALEPGSFTVLIGPTGAGKTTLMRLMAGLDKPTTGHVAVDGRDVARVPVRKRNIAMVYQQFINYPSFTVYDNIASPLRRAGRKGSDVDGPVRDAAETLGLSRLLDRFPGELSGGQQQRTALARALVKDADLLLLDEPLVNLDYKLREELRVELRRIFARRASIVVYATTEPAEALIMGGNTVVLDQGRVLQNGPTHHVYHHPATEAVGRTFADPPMNFVDGEIAGGRVRLGPRITLPAAGHLQTLADGTYRFGVRPSHLSVHRRESAETSFTARLELAEISGSETYLHLGFDGASWVLEENGVHPMAIDRDIEVFLSPHNVFVFGRDGALVASPPRERALEAAQ
jgi:glycerol transport system ATP-binding protein